MKNVQIGLCCLPLIIVKCVAFSDVPQLRYQRLGPTFWLLATFRQLALPLRCGISSIIYQLSSLMVNSLIITYFHVFIRTSPSFHRNKKLEYKVYVLEQVSKSIEQRAQIAEYEGRAKSERRTKSKKVIDSFYQVNSVMSSVKRFFDFLGSISKISDKILSYTLKT